MEYIPPTKENPYPDNDYSKRATLSGQLALFLGGVLVAIMIIVNKFLKWFASLGDVNKKTK